MHVEGLGEPGMWRLFGSSRSDLRWSSSVQLRNGIALSGNLQILCRNSFFLFLKSLHHFCLEIVKQLLHPLLLLRDASFKAFSWWLHTLALLEIDSL